MLLDFTHVPNIFIVCGKTVLRKGIDGLAFFVTETYELDVFDQSLFLFCGTKSDCFKALYWEGDGFLLLYKLWKASHNLYNEKKKIMRSFPILMKSS